MRPPAPPIPAAIRTWLSTSPDLPQAWGRLLGLAAAWSTIPAGERFIPGLTWALAHDWQCWLTAPLTECGRKLITPPPSLALHLPPEIQCDPLAATALLPELYLLVLRKFVAGAGRRQLGMVFTPRPVADHLVPAISEHVFPLPEQTVRILEPSAGGGVFLQALIAHRLHGLEPYAWPAAYADLVSQHLFAVERDPVLAALCNWRLRDGWWRLQTSAASRLGQPMPEPPEALEPHVRCADFLLADWRGPDWPAQFDLVLGNPPFGFGESMPAGEREQLRVRYHTAQGQFDRAWCFTEAAINALAPRGVLGFLLPDALLVRPEAGVLREWLVRETEVLSTLAVGPAFDVAGISGAALLVRKRSQPRATLPADPSQLFRQHLPAAPPLESGAGPSRLGEFVRISRGEEVGTSACVLLTGTGIMPVIRGRDLTMLGPLVPRVGLPGPAMKAAATYASPKLMLCKTGTSPTVACDLRGSLVALQSVYLLHPLEAIHATGIPLPVLAWALASPLAQAWFAARTCGKRIFPQLNQRDLAEFPLPTLERLELLTQTLQPACPHLLQQGWMGVADQPQDAELVRVTNTLWG